TDAPIDIKRIFEKREPITAAQEEWDDSDTESGSEPDDQRGRAVGSKGAPAANGGGGDGSIDRDPQAVACVGSTHTPPPGVQGAAGSGQCAQGVNHGQDAPADQVGQGVRVRPVASGGESEAATMVAQPVGGNQGPRQNASAAPEGKPAPVQSALIV